MPEVTPRPESSEAQKDSSDSQRKSKSRAHRDDEYAKLYQSSGHPLFYPIRKIRGWWQHWEIDEIPARLSFGSMRALRRSLSFKGNEYVVDGESEVTVKSWPSKTTLANPVWWLIWTGSFAWRWLVSRSLAPMLLAVPGVLAFATITTFSLRGSMVSDSTEAARYRRLLGEISSDDASEKDIAKSRLLADALMRLDPESQKTGIVRALVEEESGNLEQAKAMMKEIAKINKSPQAAMWLAQKARVEDTEFSNWPDENKRQYFDWLMVAINNNPTDPVPRRLLGDVFREIGEPEKAYQVMEPIANTSNENACIVAFLENELGMVKQAKARAKSLEASFGEHLAQSPGDVFARTQRSILLLLLEREGDAVELLQAGLEWTKSPKEEAVLKTALTEALVVQARKIPQQDKSPRALMASLEKLREAMSYDPANKSLLDAVIEVSIKAAQSQDSELLILQEAVVQGVESDASHFIYGTTCLMQRKVEEANRHLELALQNNPNLPGLLNNLAYALTQQDEPDLERALNLSNAAVTALPENTYVRETRGSIYLALGQHIEAISDLEFAISSPELRKMVRPKLVRAYKALGDEKLAARHQALLDSGR